MMLQKVLVVAAMMAAAGVVWEIGWRFNGLRRSPRN